MTIIYQITLSLTLNVKLTITCVIYRFPLESVKNIIYTPTDNLLRGVDVCNNTPRGCYYIYRRACSSCYNCGCCDLQISQMIWHCLL